MYRVLSIVALAFFCACGKTTIQPPENQYELSLEIEGEIGFPAGGGDMELKITAFLLEKKHGEKKFIHPNKLKFKLANGIFSIAGTENNSDYRHVEITVAENPSESTLTDILKISAAYEGTDYYSSVELTQLPSVVTSEKYIECEENGPFALPAEGGTITISFKALNRKYLNGTYRESAPTDLSGLHFEYVSVNSVHHSYNYGKTGDEPGSYFFEFTAECPYNFNYWFSEDYDYTEQAHSYMRIINLGEDTELLRLDFTQPQTPGDDYYMGKSYFYHRAPLDI